MKVNCAILDGAFFIQIEESILNILLIIIIMYILDFKRWPVAQWIESLFPKQKVVDSPPIWSVFFYFWSFLLIYLLSLG